jgi:hypothetical protein
LINRVASHLVDLVGEPRDDSFTLSDLALLSMETSVCRLGLIVQIGLPVFMLLVTRDQEPIDLIEFREVMHHSLPLFQASSRCLEDYLLFLYLLPLPTSEFSALTTTDNLQP